MRYRIVRTLLADPDSPPVTGRRCQALLPRPGWPTCRYRARVEVQADYLYFCTRHARTYLRGTLQHFHT